MILIDFENTHDPGVVDERVELGEPAGDGIVQCAYFRRLGDVAAKGLKAGKAQSRHFQRLFVAAGDDNGVALFDQPPRQFQADAAAAAGDQDRPIGKSHFFRSMIVCDERI